MAGGMTRPDSVEPTVLLRAVMAGVFKDARQQKKSNNWHHQGLWAAEWLLFC
jgi:hypothetical protein